MQPGNRVLTPDELLTTTRSVRKKLDLSRPVNRNVIEDCVKVALQAPSASNSQKWAFLAVTDQSLKDELSRLYRRGSESYFAAAAAVRNRESLNSSPTTMTQAAIERLRSSAQFLVEHLSEVPVLVIPCYHGRPEKIPFAAQAALWLSIIPASWSFALAARARGLGTTFTTFHLAYEEEAAKLLGIPYEQVMQVALMPVAYVSDSNFRPARRKKGISSVLHWNMWEGEG